MKIEIKCRFTGRVLFEHDCENNTIKATVQKALAVKANLSGSDLRNSDLRNSDLNGSDLSYSDLRNSDLRNSDLNGSNLSYSNLIYSDLSYSNLNGSNLSYSNLNGSDLRNSDLNGSDLSYSNLREAKLKDGSKITDAKRPVFSLGPIGSEQRMMMAFATDSGIKIQTGCFFGTVEEFKAQLTKKHSGNIHEKEYLASLAMIETHFEIRK